SKMHQNMYRFEIRKFKGKAHVVRIWEDGHFPVNPVKGIDIRSNEKDTNVRNTTIEDSRGQIKEGKSSNFG
ncbi:MAG: hypothetical protein ACHQ1D_11620, partial [Nitrososphaerales archaeon]